jgi:hypothetical protein
LYSPNRRKKTAIAIRTTAIVLGRLAEGVGIIRGYLLT